MALNAIRMLMTHSPCLPHRPSSECQDGTATRPRDVPLGSLIGTSFPAPTRLLSTFPISANFTSSSPVCREPGSRPRGLHISMASPPRPPAFNTSSLLVPLPVHRCACGTCRCNRPGSPLPSPPLPTLIHSKAPALLGSCMISASFPPLQS